MRLRERHHAGGARIDGVWAAQDEIYLQDIAADANKEALTYQKRVESKSADPMRLPSAVEISSRSGEGSKFDRRRRGQKAMAAMREQQQNKKGGG